MSGDDERREVYADLRSAMIHQKGAILWIHMTDEQLGQFDLDRLMEHGLIMRVPQVVYEPKGTWQDDFPPLAYALTPKARAILHDPRLWVIEDKWNTEQK